MFKVVCDSQSDEIKTPPLLKVVSKESATGVMVEDEHIRGAMFVPFAPGSSTA